MWRELGDKSPPVESFANTRMRYPEAEALIHIAYLWLLFIVQFVFSWPVVTQYINTSPVSSLSVFRALHVWRQHSEPTSSHCRLINTTLLTEKPISSSMQAHNLW